MYLDSMIMRGTLVASGVTHHAGICVPDVAISHYCQPYYHDAFFPFCGDGEELSGRKNTSLLPPDRHLFH